MRRRKGNLTSDDVKAWHHVAKQAKPMPGKTIPDAPPEPVVPAELLPPEETPVLVEKPKKRVARPLPPLATLDRRARRDVARGLAVIDGRIDLHGMRQAEAHRTLIDFVYRAHQQGWKLGLVITGKGGGVDARGEERGVLRRLVPHWLADPSMRAMVLGYEAASPGHGGEGALYLRFRRARVPREP
ncbi:MAG: Smr/MutS family protein [Rhabdaerophilum sp.]